MSTAAQRRAIARTEPENDPHVRALLDKLAAVQLAEGTTLVDGNTWAWVQAFCDFDYEYAWLVDVRTSTAYRGSLVTTSDYLAIFKGYDAHGVSVVRVTWWGHPATFPDIPNLYDALAWWAAWVKDTRTGEHNHG